MGDALWKDYYLPCGWGRRKKEILNRGYSFMTFSNDELRRIYTNFRIKINIINKKRDESMGGALWKEFYLNILSKLQYSSKILFKQLRWHGFYPLGKRQSKIAKKLRKWEQYEENLFSFKLPSKKFLAIGKNRTACYGKSHADDKQVPRGCGHT